MPSDEEQGLNACEMISDNDKRMKITNEVELRLVHKNDDFVVAGGKPDKNIKSSKKKKLSTNYYREIKVYKS